MNLSDGDDGLTQFELESWDSGRLIVNRDYANLLKQQGLQTFAAIWDHTAEAAIAKKLRTDRITQRFTLQNQGNEQVFFIKRHTKSSWKEYVKPLLRLTWPILGARNEWNALLHFHAAGLPTMIPVALGESGSNSFLITAALENCVKLSEVNCDEVGAKSGFKQQLIRDVALLAKRMHAAGLNHQDFYLGHLMLSQADPRTIYIIDLGRVQKHVSLSRRWIVKDLAQLNYSATAVLDDAGREYFLQEYLGRQPMKDDQALIDRIRVKTQSIARHSRRNRL